MNPRISVALAGVLLAAFGLFATEPQTSPKSNPAEAARLNNLGAAYMNQQLFEKALKSFQQAAELDPKLTMARLNEGIAQLNLQKIDEAKAALEDALKQDPKDPNAWYNVGLLAKNTGDAQAAIEAFHHVVELDPNDADSWYFLGTSYVQAKQFSQAIDAFHHALQLNPLHASAEFGLSRAYQQSGEVDHARENLKKFQYITQNKLGAPMSLAYGEQGQYSRAVESPQQQLKPPSQIKVRFVDVTKEAGIISKHPPKQGDFSDDLGSGACFFDYDNDGNIDLLLMNDGPDGGTVLYHNLGEGKFEDATEKLLTWTIPTSNSGQFQGVGCATGDYDNDGFADVAYTFPTGSQLLHNEKDGTFDLRFSLEHGLRDGAAVQGISHKKDREIASRGPVVGGVPGPIYTFRPMSVTFIDYDHDGDLDLYITQPTILKKKPESSDGMCPPCRSLWPNPDLTASSNVLWRNNGDGTFTNVTDTTGLSGSFRDTAAIGTDFNNDRAVDLLITGGKTPKLFENPREGKFLDRSDLTSAMPSFTNGVVVLDFDHDGWMDYAFSQMGTPGLTLWRNNHGKSFEQVKLPETNWVGAYGVAAFDYDNDGWVDLVAVGETKEGKGEIKLFRNLGADGFKDVTADVGLDKIHLEGPRAIITGDYDNDGATDLLITQNHGPAVLLRNEGGNQNRWLRLSLNGLADNKSAIGTKVEVFAGGNRQKFEIAGSNGYLGQNSPYLTVGLGDAKEADIVRMLWPTGVLQDEINVAGDRQQNFTEMDRRGSSCPTLFVWNGERYEFVADMLGAGVVGHWVGPGQRDVPRPVEWVKIDRGMIRERKGSQTACHPERSEGPMPSPASCKGPAPQKGAAQDEDASEGANNTLSFRFMEPLEEAVYLDQVRLLAVDHPAGTDVYPNEYFASNPPYPEFKVVISKDAHPPAGAWDDHGHDVLPDLREHRYFGDFTLTQFQGFAKPHSLTLDLGQAYRAGPLWLLMHGEVEYFSANSMYAASQAGIQAISPYVEALVQDKEGHEQWKRVVDDMGFPAGGPRTMTADLTDKLPAGTRKIRITTNLQVYWDSILIDRTEQVAPAFGRLSRGRLVPAASSATDPALPPGRRRYDLRTTAIPLVHANLDFHGYPLKIEGTPPGNVEYIYEKTSATGPYTRPAGSYTRYGDVLPLLTATDDRQVVFGSGDEVRLDFDSSRLPPLPQGWVRDYFFAANGYEKDMDFYAAEGNYVAPLPFLSMSGYPYVPKQSFPLDDAHVNYLLEYNTRQMSGNEQRGYWFDYGPSK
jgi:tetratricopeptide (TPR) repeat protein